MFSKVPKCFLIALWLVMLAPFALAEVESDSDFQPQAIEPLPVEVSEEFVADTTREQEFIYTVPISGAVELALRNVVSRALREAKRNNAQTIIFEIDTLGGRLDAAVEISKMLSDAPQETVAFINTRAISAGALIALSCKRIIMKEGSTMGAATPVQLSPSGDSQPTDEKAISYVRAEFRAAAERNGHRPDIAEAMVDKDLSVEGISEEGKLLTLDARQAFEFGVAEALVEHKQGLLGYLSKESAQEIILEEFWMERIARFLAHPMMSGLLMMVGMLCIWLAVRTPGLGVPEMCAIVCFALFFWGHAIAGLAGWETFLLFLVGAILLFIELFVTPGFGVVGMSGIAFIVTSLALTLTEYPINSEFFRMPDLLPPLYLLTWSLFGSVVLAVVLAKILPKTSFYHWIVLEHSENKAEGYHSSEDKAISVPMGARGVSMSVLRPSGLARFDKGRYDVVSQGDYIPSGVPVEVIRIEGRRLVVRRVQG